MRGEKMPLLEDLWHKKEFAQTFWGGLDDKGKGIFGVFVCLLYIKNNQSTSENFTELTFFAKSNDS